MGTSDFAVAVLRRLAASSHAPSLVVTRPDRPRGRGRKVQPPPVADAARELGIEVFQPDSVNSEDARARITAERPDEVVICAFGALIRDPLLSEHPMLNVHPSPARSACSVTSRSGWTTTSARCPCGCRS